MAGGGQDTPLMSLSEELLLAVGEGRVTVATASRLAAARVREGGADATCTALAACQGQNGERNLHVWARGQPWRQLVPEPYHFTAPMRKKAREVTGTCYCILPHLFFSTLAREARPIFDSLFGDEDERVQFWRELQRTTQETPAGRRGEMHKQWYDKHPVIKSTAPEQRVPVGLHGDGGEMTSGQKVMVLSWGGLCNPGSTLDTRLLFMVIKESIAEPAGHATLYAAFDVLVWSLNAMADNMHPRVDHAGRAFGPEHWPQHAALAGSPLTTPPLHAAWLELRGDWQYLRAALNLAHHYNSGSNICHLCSVTKKGRGCFADHVSRGSAMRMTLVSGSTWVQGDRARSSPLCQIKGFHIWRCAFDPMHTLELGLLQLVIPAALKELMGVTRNPGVFGGGPVGTRCTMATRAYLAWAKTVRISSSARVRAITPGWVKGARPHLSQSHAKAAALRAMLPWVAKLCVDRRAVSPHRATVLEELYKMDCVWRDAGRFLSQGQAEAAAKHCEKALEALAALCAAHPNGPWHVVPKAHSLTHMAYDNALCNPRASHCYQDEDFVGRMKRIYSRCHGVTAPMRATQRYAIHTALRLSARLQLLLGFRPAGHQRAPRARGRPPRPVQERRPRGRPKSRP